MDATIERVQVPWVGEVEVWIRRLRDEDVDVAGDWLDVYLQGDYFFRRRHLRGILTRPQSEGWGVEVAGLLVGVVILYQGSRLHNLYLAPEWRSRGLGGALINLLQPTEVRAKTNMLAADPTAFYEKMGFEVVSQDPRRPHILNMARKRGEHGMHVAPNAPGATISEQPGSGDPVPGGKATSPPINPTPAFKTPPSTGQLTVDQVQELAAKLRSLSDDELVALAHGSATLNVWKKRQQASRERRLEKERAQAAADAGVHLAPGLTGETRARIARARAAAAVEDMFGGSSNGEAIKPHSE